MTEAEAAKVIAVLLAGAETKRLSDESRAFWRSSLLGFDLADGYTAARAAPLKITKSDQLTIRFFVDCVRDARDRRLDSRKFLPPPRTHPSKIHAYRMASETAVALYRLDCHRAREREGIDHVVPIVDESWDLPRWEGVIADLVVLDPLELEAEHRRTLSELAGADLRAPRHAGWGRLSKCSPRPSTWVEGTLHESQTMPLEKI